MNPFFWSSSAAFFLNQQFKLKWLPNPNSTCLGQTHSVVTIFQAALLVAGQTKPLTLKRFSVFWGRVGNPAEDLNFATETHAAFNCCEKRRRQRWGRTEVRQRGHHGAPRSVSPRRAVFLGKGRKEMTLSYIEATIFTGFAASKPKMTTKEKYS